jgi:peptide/nickel transport system ATP-binding protein
MPPSTCSTRGLTHGFDCHETSIVSEPLLEVRDLSVAFRTEDGVINAVDGVSFALNRGEILGIVGESGSGKSVTMMTVMRLIIDPNAVFEGQVLYKGRDLMKLSQAEMRKVRGSEIAMIFQDPMTSLTPVYTIGWQIEEQLHAHARMSRRAARTRAIELLDAVGIPNATTRANDYPHQFSGGMRQRVMIAMALANNPSVLIADEPTTALDVTIQAQILQLIKGLRSQLDSAVVLITHDMGVIADVADRVSVMYAGRVIEAGTKNDLFYDPQHPYTWGLLGSIPRLDRIKPKRLAAIPGQPPSLLELPAGCAFRPRCAQAFDPCAQSAPALESRSDPHHVDACFLSTEQKRSKRAATIDPPRSSTGT